MILLWTMLGLLLAFSIGRINKSNKLFWILFISFMTGIAGGSLYNKCKEAKSEERASVVAPTVGHASTTINVTVDDANISSALTLNTLGKEFYGTNVCSIATCKLCETIHTPPPELNSLGTCSNILTHPDNNPVLRTELVICAYARSKKPF